MKRSTKALIVLAIAGTVTIAFSPSPASATEEETVEQAWIMPNDGTDWPQPIASEANLAALPCGTTWRIQNDRYLPAERDRFAADGILEYQEDWGNDAQRGAISWYFSEFVTPACVVDPPVEPPVVVPPVEPPVVVPPVAPPVEQPPVEAPPVETEPQLAETGPWSGTPWLAGVGIILLASGYALLRRRAA